MSTSGAFDLLPDEVIHVALSFCDLPSLGEIAQTSKTAVIARLACSDEAWANLVERRFRISTKKSRPVLHGGHSWKQSYFSMSYSDRMPRGRYTSSQKAVFAKGRSSQRKSSGLSPFASPVRLWVLVGHTENCRTRTIQPVERPSRSALSNDESNNERFVELYLCMQNVKSGAGEVTVDVLESTLSLMGSSEGSDALISRVRRDATFSSSMQPKVLFHDATTVDDPLDYDISNGIKLRPFDVAVISVHFPCASDVFETDFLARALSVHVPVRKQQVKPTTKNNAATSTTVKVSSSLTPRDAEASAYFIPETDVWNYYMELPGNCLTLVDRFQMANV